MIKRNDRLFIKFFTSSNSIVGKCTVWRHPVFTPVSHRPKNRAPTLVPQSVPTPGIHLDSQEKVRVGPTTVLSQWTLTVWPQGSLVDGKTWRIGRSVIPSNEEVPVVFLEGWRTQETEVNWDWRFGSKFPKYTNIDRVVVLSGKIIEFRSTNHWN